MVDELPSDSTDPKYRLTLRHLIPTLVINNANHGTCTTHNHSYYVEASLDTTTIPAQLVHLGMFPHPLTQVQSTSQLGKCLPIVSPWMVSRKCPFCQHRGMRRPQARLKGGGANTHNTEAMVKSTRKIHINQHKSLKDMFHPCHKSSCQPAKILRAGPAK